ncbi:MAG: TonB-dependent receptor [Steroidobacteraceae bacterium]
MSGLPARSISHRPSVAFTVAAILSAAAAHAAPAPAPAPGPMFGSATLQEVVVTAKKMQLKSLKQRSIYHSAYGDKALDRQQLKSAGVVGGAAQALSFAPGISVSGYGQTGGTKASISINGLNQGWAGVSPGTVDNGNLAISFDGIPMVNAATGLWETPEIPQTALLQGARVTYGPGDPESRWYNNMGGGVNFVPVQPTSTPSGYVQLTGGSFSTENADVILQTGNFHGWETVIGGGAGRANSFHTSPDGFAWPTRNFAGFFKTRREFDGGSSVSFGAYMGAGHGWRPVPVPLTPVPGLSVNGIGAPGALLSEATTGYYGSVNENVWRKNDSNRTWLVYARQNIRLTKRTTLHNQLWYREGDRLHNHYNNFGLGTPGAGNLYEHNDPTSHMYGDKIWSDMYLPYNTLGVGGYFINTTYNSRNAFYNPGVCVVTPSAITLTGGTSIPAGTSVCGSASVPNANHRSDYWYVTDLAAFFQDAISPIRSLTITPGIRVVNFHTDYYPYGATYFQLADILGQPTLVNPNALGLFSGHDQGLLPAAQTNYNKTEPSVSARWQPIDWLALYANWSTAYRLPQVGGGGGLYQSEPVGGNILQRSLEYQAGFKLFWPMIGDFQKVLVNVNYFHDHLSNQIIGVNSTAGDFLGLGTGDSIYRGVNFSAEANWNTLKVFTNLNVEKAYFNSYEFAPAGGGVTNYSGRQVSDTPQSTFNVGAYWTYRFANGIAVKPRAWYQYTGPQYIFDNNSGAPSNQEIGGYGVLNLALAASLPRSWYGDMAKSVKLKLEVMNALDRKYNFFEYISAGGLYGTASAGYPLAYAGPPRAVYGTISVRF